MDTLIRRILLLIALSLIVVACTPFSRIHDRVYNQFDYVSDMERYGEREHWGSKTERRVNGRIIGDCDEFALEVYDQAKALGLDPVMIAMYRTKEDGQYSGHLVTMVDNKISSNTDVFLTTMSDWIEDGWEFYYVYKDGTRYRILAYYNHMIITILDGDYR